MAQQQFFSLTGEATWKVSVKSRIICVFYTESHFLADSQNSLVDFTKCNAQY